MQTLGAQRLYAALHQEKPYHDGSFQEWVKEPSLTHPFRYDDGVTIGVSRLDLTPDDDFLEQSSAAAKQSDADSD